MYLILEVDVNNLIANNPLVTYLQPPYIITHIHTYLTLTLT